MSSITRINSRCGDIIFPSSYLLSHDARSRIHINGASEGSRSRSRELDPSAADWINRLLVMGWNASAYEQIVHRNNSLVL